MAGEEVEVEVGGFAEHRVCGGVWLPCGWRRESCVAGEVGFSVIVIQTALTMGTGVLE